MKQGEIWKGAAWIVGSSAVYAGMSALVKQITAMGVDPYKTTLFRFVIGLTILASAALGGKIRLSFGNGPLLVLRGLLGGACVFSFFLLIPRIGIARATVLIFTSTIFAALFSAAFLKERIAPAAGAAIAAAMAGMYLVAGGGEEIFSWSRFGPYELLAVATGAVSGLTKCLIKKLHETDTSYSIFFAQCAMGIWIVIVPANLVSCPIGYLGGALLLGIGVLGAVGQVACTEGYRHLPVSAAALLELSFPVFNLLLGVLGYGEPLSPAGLLGSGLILASCAAVIYLNRRACPGENR